MVCLNSVMRYTARSYVAEPGKDPGTIFMCNAKNDSRSAAGPPSSPHASCVDIHFPVISAS